MYIIFQEKSGIWSVGYFDSSKNWIHASQHKSLKEAKDQVILLNNLKFPKFAEQTLTLQDVITYIDSLNPESVKYKAKLCRLKNILCLLSNTYIYTSQITNENFLSVKNSGEITYLLYLQILVDIKIHRNQSKNEIIEI